jgi:hypothetical protein
MVFQARAIRVSREQASREHLAHLIELSLEDPVYQRCWGSDTAPGPTRDRYRQLVYLNLIVSHWENDYVLGGFREHALRGAFAWLFRGEAGRIFWADARGERPPMSESRRAKKFCRIAEQEYQKALVSGPPTVKAQVPPPQAAPVQQPATTYDGTVMKTSSALLIGITSGIALAKVLWPRK